MGSFLSMASNKSNQNECNEVYPNQTCMRQRSSPASLEECPGLIPNLPDELSLQIIARLPRICYYSLRLVSRQWKEAIMSSELYKLRKVLGITEEWLYLLVEVGKNKLLWYALDPHSCIWQRLPIMPNDVDEEPQKGSSRPWKWNMAVGLLGQKDALDELSFRGCSFGAVDGCLYVLGGFSKDSAKRRVLRFDPIQNAWTKVTSMSTGRIYCKTGCLNNKLYVVGGFGIGPAGWDPHQSAEVFDLCTNTWSHIPSMPFSRAGLLSKEVFNPSTLRIEMLKPFATGLASYRGKLHVTQTLHPCPSSIDVGQIYDPETNSWMEMPTGMGEGWPTPQSGTKWSVVVNGELYAFVDSMYGGKIKVYDQGEDAWKVAIGKVPAYHFTDSSCRPYLLTGLHGKLHFIKYDGSHDVTVLQADPCSYLDSSLPTSPLSHESTHGLILDSVTETDAVVWKVVASRRFGQVELINCQVIDI
ncbi:hypothetical protein RJT34_12132 [Clitoria ternatea]|uniref:F-box domain-containing protein n=1 Tax=Clitoria ternatea TaxID=43366 RepID=A0AAN9JN56_CLITE